MSSMYINNLNKLNNMFKLLYSNGIFANNLVIKKLAKLINEDVDVFIERFTKDFVIKDFTYNKFEILKLNSADKSKLDNCLLYRYEYRNKTNLRTLFAVKNEREEILILEAFNENGGKIKGKDSYDKAIKNAISNYTRIKEEYYNE